MTSPGAFQTPDLFGDAPLPPPAAAAPATPLQAHVPPPVPLQARPASPASPERPPFPDRAVRASPFWFCLHLPALPLEVLPPAEGSPRAIEVEQGQRAWVLAADEQALAGGVRPGMASATALALLPALQLQSRSPGREAAALRRLADALSAFTPAVAVVDDAILLEVRASLRLFGGAAVLRRRLAAAVQRCGHHGVIAAAPTARSALWLARAGRGHDPDAGAAPGAGLGGLPLACTGWPAEALQLIGRFGIDTLGGLQRLPREGLARRLGTRLLRELDEAWGRAPEVWRWHVPATSFSASLELPAETGDLALLAAACRVLVARLGARLQQSQAGVRQLWLTLAHAGPVERRPADTRLRLGLRAATGDPALLQRLLELRLAALPLPSPVVSLALQAPLLADCPSATRSWLPEAVDAADRLAGLVERLRARLGDTAVRRLAPAPDHRPERAWRWVAPAPAALPDDAGAVPAAAPRPCWLFATPRRLREVGGVPAWQGPLMLDDTPERIESGWWDGADVRREYHVARNARGRCGWVFRDLRTGGWYLHGVFQ
jgi:protein ImuB